MYLSHGPTYMSHVTKYVYQPRTTMYETCHEICTWVTDYVYEPRTTLYVQVMSRNKYMSQKNCIWVKKYVCESKNMYMGPELRIRPTFRTNTYHELFYEYTSRHKMCIWVTKYVFKPRTMSIRAQNLTQHLRVIWLVYMYDMIYSCV